MPALLMKYGPLSVGIDTDNDYIDNYERGVFPASKCGKDIDHAVAIVGFTSKTWIVKNSWGIDQGEKGYLYIRMYDGDKAKINNNFIENEFYVWDAEIVK